jgi:hypothetical protein
MKFVFILVKTTKNLVDTGPCDDIRIGKKKDAVFFKTKEWKRLIHLERLGSVGEMREQENIGILRHVQENLLECGKKTRSWRGIVFKNKHVLRMFMLLKKKLPTPEVGEEATNRTGCQLIMIKSSLILDIVEKLVHALFV